MVTYPESQNVFSQSVLAPVPNLERRVASAGIDEGLEEQMKTLKNLSISSLNIVSSKLLRMSLRGLSDSELSEQFMLEDFTKYDSRAMYKSVAIIDSDFDSDEKSFDKSDTD